MRKGLCKTWHLFLRFVCVYSRTLRNSLTVFPLHASTAGARVLSVVRELRFHRLCSMAKKEKENLWRVQKNIHRKRNIHRKIYICRKNKNYTQENSGHPEANTYNLDETTRSTVHPLLALMAGMLSLCVRNLPQACFLVADPCCWTVGLFPV